MEYFSVSNWRNLKILEIYTEQKTFDIENIEDKFDFPHLQTLRLCIVSFNKSCENSIICIK